MDIIYFGNDWSAENRTSSHHIAAQLSKNHNILYIECPGLRAPKGNKRDITKAFKKLASLFKKPIKISTNLTVYTLLQIPFHNNQAISKINIFLSVFLLKKVCKQVEFQSPILWFVVPHAGHLIGRLNEIMTVYYCIDDYSALPDVNIAAVRKMDYNLTVNADIVFTASRTLTEKKRKVTDKVYYSPHGVEFDHFNYANAVLNTSEIPSDIIGLSRPIIGFFGLLEAWIDLELIQEIALHYSYMNIVLIGRSAVDTQILNSLDNVYLLGKKPFSDLPAYANNFDICILPYKDNDQIFNCNPIKLKEYLATGKPVVSVSFPEISEYSDVVLIANTNDEFIEYINLALMSDSTEKRARRISSVENQTWENRVEEILLHVEKEYKSKTL